MFRLMSPLKALVAQLALPPSATGTGLTKEEKPNTEKKIGAGVSHAAAMGYDRHCWKKASAFLLSQQG